MGTRFGRNEDPVRGRILTTAMTMTRARIRQLGMLMLLSSNSIQAAVLNFARGVQPVQKRLDDLRRPHEVALRLQKIAALSISEAEKKTLKERPDSEQGKKLSRTHAQKLELADNDFHSANNEMPRNGNSMRWKPCW